VPICPQHHLGIVLDYQQRVAELAQLVQDLAHTLLACGVEPEGRLVQCDQQTAKARGQLGREPDALGLATGQARARAIHGQVPKAELHESRDTP
jgi:hypothetical protein